MSSYLKLEIPFFQASSETYDTLVKVNEEILDAIKTNQEPIITGSDIINIVTLIILTVTAWFIYLQARAARIQTQKISPGEKLVNAHNFILTIQTDKESLEARDAFYRIHHKMRRDAGRAEVLRVFKEAKKEVRPKKPNKLIGEKSNEEQKIYHDKYTLWSKHRSDLALYNHLIRHVNLLEVMATGIKTGAMDEDHLKAFKRNGLIDDICLIQDAVNFLRKKSENPRIFEEAVWLAWRWLPESGKSAARLEIDKERLQITAPHDPVGYERTLPVKRSLSQKIADLLDPDRDPNVKK